MKAIKKNISIIFIICTFVFSFCPFNLLTVRANDDMTLPAEYTQIESITIAENSELYFNSSSYNYNIFSDYYIYFYDGLVDDSLPSNLLYVRSMSGSSGALQVLEFYLFSDDYFYASDLSRVGSFYHVAISSNLITAGAVKYVSFSPFSNLSSSVTVGAWGLTNSDGKWVCYFVPCINSSGSVGFYDVVNEQFYSDSSMTRGTLGSITDIPKQPTPTPTPTTTPMPSATPTPSTKPTALPVTTPDTSGGSDTDSPEDFPDNIKVLYSIYTIYDAVDSTSNTKGTISTKSASYNVNMTIDNNGNNSLSRTGSTTCKYTKMVNSVPTEWLCSGVSGYTLNNSTWSNKGTITGGNTTSGDISTTITYMGTATTYATVTFNQNVTGSITIGGTSYYIVDDYKLQDVFISSQRSSYATSLDLNSLINDDVAITFNLKITASQSTDASKAYNQALSNKSDEMNDIENSFSNSFDEQYNNIDLSSNNINVTKSNGFVNAAKWVNEQFTSIISNKDKSLNAIGLSVSFSLVLGFALLMMGRRL